MTRRGRITVLLKGGIPHEVEYSFYGGSLGSREEPPEEPEVDIEGVSAAGVELDVDQFTDEEYNELLDAVEKKALEFEEGCEDYELED